jgi:hypothetical protein
MVEGCWSLCCPSPYPTADPLYVTLEGVTVRAFDLGEWGADAQAAIRALAKLGGEARVEDLHDALGFDLTRLNAVMVHCFSPCAATKLPILTRAAARGFYAYLTERTWDGLPPHMQAQAQDMRPLDQVEG